MFHKPVSGLAGIALLLACAAIAQSEDFHVSTRIDNLRAVPPAGKKESRPPSMLCESLFNAGKVYDYNGEGSEVTIFEPAQERFVIIDTAKRTSTVVSFVYIDQRLHQAHAVRSAELKRAPNEMSKEKAGYLDFELHPKFTEEFDKKGNRLILDSPFVRYKLKCVPARSPDLLKAYLNYADWAARLNYVSYRTTSLPDPRLAVNERLRQKGLLPVSVELLVKLEDGAHMKADHKFTWELVGDNRSAISYWDKMATARDVKHLSPNEFFAQTIKQAAKIRR
jgi:hypothetical protein